MTRGDTVVYSALGAKRRPWVVLYATPTKLLTTSLSTGKHTPVQQLSKCPNWPGSWLGGTVDIIEPHRILHLANQQLPDAPFTAFDQLDDITNAWRDALTHSMGIFA